MTEGSRQTAWLVVLLKIAIGLVGVGVFIGFVELIKSLVKDVQNGTWYEFATDLVFLGIAFGALAFLAYFIYIPWSF